MPSGYLPAFEIYKGGENITARFEDRAVSVIVRLAAGSGDQDTCEIVLDDRGWMVATPTVGDRIEVRLGYTGIGLAYMGSFEISRIRYSFPPKQISVIGTAASSLSEIKSQRVTNYDGKTVEQILAEFGAQVGMKVKVHPEIADEKLKFLNAETMSFQGLVAKLESRYGAVAKILDGRVTLTPRGSGDSVSDISLPTFVLRPEHFAECEVLHESSGEYKKTTAKWRDPKTHQLQTVESGTKLNDNKSEAVHAIAREWPTQAEAQAAADSVQGQLDRSTGKIQAMLSAGDPWLRDGQRIVITDAREGINGSYLVDLVQHSYSKDRALVTTFTGSAGTDGLAEEYAAGTSPSDFVAPLPDQVFGQALQQRDGTTLERPFNSVPSFSSIPTPRFR